MAESEPYAELEEGERTGKTSPVARVLLVVFLVCLVAAAVYGLFFTTYGEQARDKPHLAGLEFQKWVSAHRLIAPAILLLLYMLLTLALMPVWWLQILVGYAFGLWLGIAYSLTGAMLGAVASFLMARTLLADYVHTRFEAKHTKLRALDEKMGHNGLLIVMAARLMHFLPFGVSNYLFGISRITLMDVVLGTFLGNAPMIALYTAMGAGMKPLRNWRFMVCLTIANIVLLVPVVLRYWRPHWFKRIGVE